MLTQDEQAAILRKAQAMQRNFYLRRHKVARSEMSKKRCDELCEQDEEELRELLKEAG